MQGSKKITIFILLLMLSVIFVACTDQSASKQQDNQPKTVASTSVATETSKLETMATSTELTTENEDDVQTMIKSEQLTTETETETETEVITEVEEKRPTRQSDLMLSYTGSPWSEELEMELIDVDFSVYGFDPENPTLITDVDSIFVLANKANYFPETYVPSDLVAPQSRYAGGGDRNRLKKVAADSFDQLVAAAAKADYDIQNVSAYRSIDYQKMLFNSYVERDGIKKANKYSSKPGFSEHHTGLCLDVSSPVMGFGLDQSYGQTKEGIWLAENAADFGFVIRYPEGKANLTGYTYEPWHIRYFGVPLAKYLYENKLTYEEFLALQNGISPEQIIID